MICKECRIENLSDALFCQNCGAQMPEDSLTLGLELDFSNVKVKEIEDDSIETDEKIEAPIDVNNIYNSSKVNKNSNLGRDSLHQDSIPLNIGMYTSPNERMHLISSEAHPWKRFFAKMLDRILIFFIIIAIFIIYIFSSEDQEGAISFIATTFNSRFINIMILLIPTIFLEAIMLSLGGATLGKWLLGMKVVNNDGSKLNFLTALNRNSLVFIKGEGLWLGIIPLITYLYSYYSLTNNKITSWDEGLGIRLIHVPVGIFRAIIVALLSLLGIYVIFTNILTIFFTVFFCL
jgi:uncharacterized RDD family membrane protein YckC